MKENKRKYNAIDFASYHSGKMAPAEMHALEKAALDDPFLAEALEGYAYSRDPEGELTEINKRLLEKRNLKKSFSISSLSSGTWWKIAAMFLLFASGGYYFYANHSTKENSLAIKRDSLKKENSEIASPLHIDTTTSEEHLAFEKNPGAERNNNDVSKLHAPVSKSRHPLSENSEVHNDGFKKDHILPEKNPASKRENEMMLAAEKSIPAKRPSVESAEKLRVHSPDTITTASASLDVSSRSSEHDVAMKNEQATLNDVVVSGYGTQKKKDLAKVSNGELQGRVSGVQINNASPYLENRKENFDQYIKDNAVIILDSTGQRMAANVLLSFSLDKKGKPSHIKVLESSCKPCEIEAIRLLQEGPAWVGKKGDTGTVRIQF